MSLGSLQIESILLSSFCRTKYSSQAPKGRSALMGHRGDREISTTLQDWLVKQSGSLRCYYVASCWRRWLNSFRWPGRTGHQESKCRCKCLYWYRRLVAPYSGSAHRGHRQRSLLYLFLFGFQNSVYPLFFCNLLKSLKAYKTIYGQNSTNPYHKDETLTQK